MEDRFYTTFEERRISEVYSGGLRCVICEYSTVLPPSVVIPKEVAFCKHYQKLCSDVKVCTYQLKRE